jgi:hypothetical protein
LEQWQVGEQMHCAVSRGNRLILCQKSLDVWERQQNKIVQQTGLPPEKLNLHSHEIKRQEFEER